MYNLHIHAAERQISDVPSFQHIVIHIPKDELKTPSSLQWLNGTRAGQYYLMSFYFKHVFALFVFSKIHVNAPQTKFRVFKIS